MTPRQVSGPRFRWIALAPMKHPRAGADCGLLADGRVWVDGGSYYDTRSYQMRDAPGEVFDPETGRWSAAQRKAPRAPSAPRAQAKVTTDEKRTRVKVGGRSFTLAQRRERPTLTGLPWGDLLVTGGHETFSRFDGELDDHSVRAVELIDLARGEVVDAGQLASASHDHAALVLPSGAVLIFGGRSGDNWTARVELGIPEGLALSSLPPGLASAAGPAVEEQELDDLVEQARARGRAGDSDGALAAARDATSRFPDLRDGWDALGEALYAARRFHESADACRRALGLDEESPFARAALARALAAAGEDAEALALYQEVARRCARDPDFTGPLAREARQQLQYLGMRRGSAADLARATDDKPADDASSAEWNNRGAAHNRLGRHAEALACFERALALDPRNDCAAGNSVDALVQVGRLRDALERAEAALALDPPPARAARIEVARGIALYDLGDFAASVAAYDRALALDDTGLAWSNRGNSLLQLDRRRDALASYRRALARGFAQGHWGVVCALVASGRWRDAARAAERAFAAAPELEAGMRKDPDLAELWRRTGR